MDDEVHSALRLMAALEALRGQLHNLEETIADLLELYKSMPEGEHRDRLFYEISALDFDCGCYNAGARFHKFIGSNREKRRSRSIH